MIDATDPRARMRGLACLGRFRPAERPYGRFDGPCASRAQSVTDATSIGDGLIPRPRAASPRPEEDVPVASII